MENYDIFISYKSCSSSREAAQHLYSILKQKGYSVFVGDESFAADERNKQVIKNSKDVLVLLEEGSINTVSNNLSTVANFHDSLLGKRPLAQEVGAVAGAAAGLFRNIPIIGAAVGCVVGLSSNSRTETSNGDKFCSEIIHAIKSGKNIIPVLLDDYKMPKPSMVPSEMKKLSFCRTVKYDNFTQECLDKQLLKSTNFNK